VEGQQWTTIINNKSKGKARASSCNVVCASSREAETDVPSLTNSEEETIVLAAELNEPLVAKTRSGQSYLKKYNELVANPSGPTSEPTKPSAKQPVEKQKELRYSKALPKDKAEGTSAPYRFDVLSQLANIPARITLYELLRLSKSTRKALREALADVEIFMTQILVKPQEENKKDCLHASQNAPALPSRQTTCRSRGNIIDPCTLQGILDRLK